MSQYVYAPKQDSNQAQVVAAYEELYCKVYDTHKVGGGFGDIVVVIPTKRGKVMKAVEIKTADGKLKPNQERFMLEVGDAAAVVQTRDDVFAHVERVRGGL